MSLGQLIETHGYWVLALGCLLEGETVLVLAGFAAHRGYLDPVAVFAIAAASGFAGDQFYFWLGRRHGAWVLARWPSLAGQANRVRHLIERYHAAVIIGIRFAYGLRVAGPVLLGTMPGSALRFSWLNAVGALLWAGAVGALGWLFGDAAERTLGKLQHLEGWLLLGLACAGAGTWWIRRRRSRRSGPD
ncbi:MAG: DedA family protein [Burkholderiaceae bacterium]|nr:DedA family protein [Burkholderiaceae bacterium]